MLTRYIAPTVAFAQDQTSATKEVRAQNLTQVDSSDHIIATFVAEPIPGSGSVIVGPDPETGQPARQIVNPKMRIVLRDSSGREIWSAGGGARMLPAVITQ